MIFGDVSMNLDSLSDVKGFSSAYNGITYGLKKIGGTFIPAEVTEGQSVSGVIPGGGLYSDSVNRVGVLLNDSSGLSTSATGLSVNAGNGIKIANNSINAYSSSNTIKVNSSNGIEVNTNHGSGLYSNNTYGLRVDVDNVSTTIGGNGNKVIVNTNSGSGLNSNSTLGLYADIDNDTLQTTINTLNVNVNSPKFGGVKTNGNPNTLTITPDGVDVYSYELPARSVAIHFTEFEQTLLNDGVYIPSNCVVQGEWTIPNGVENYGYVYFNNEGQVPTATSIESIRNAISVSSNNGDVTLTNTLKVGRTRYVDEHDFRVLGSNWSTVILILPLTTASSFMSLFDLSKRNIVKI